MADGPARKRPSLTELFWAHRGLLSDKWEQYLPIYEAELGPYLERGAPVTLLEIGVQNGGSLQIWHKLLPPRSRVIGLDVDGRCRALTFDEGIELHIGDATVEAFIDEALGDTRFDIIVDDGSHHAKDVIASFEILFKRLKGGGLYVVEDLHTSYWPDYGGGFRTDGSSIEWAKTLVDAVNADHIDRAAELKSDELARLRAFNTEIARIAFFDSLLVVQKYPSPKPRPFARLLTGADSPVFDPMQWIENLPAESFVNLMAGPAAAARLEAGLKQRIEDKERVIERQERELERQQQELERQQHELLDLRGSTSWKITAPLRCAGNILKSCTARLRQIGRRSAE